MNRPHRRDGATRESLPPRGDDNADVLRPLLRSLHSPGQRLLSKNYSTENGSTAARQVGSSRISLAAESRTQDFRSNPPEHKSAAQAVAPRAGLVRRGSERQSIDQDFIERVAGTADVRHQQAAPVSQLLAQPTLKRTWLAARLGSPSRRLWAPSRWT